MLNCTTEMQVLLPPCNSPARISSMIVHHACSDCVSFTIPDCKGLLPFLKLTVSVSMPMSMSLDDCGHSTGRPHIFMTDVSPHSILHWLRTCHCQWPVGRPSIKTMVFKLQSLSPCSLFSAIESDILAPNARAPFVFSSFTCIRSGLLRPRSFDRSASM